MSYKARIGEAASPQNSRSTPARSYLRIFGAGIAGLAGVAITVAVASGAVWAPTAPEMNQAELQAQELRAQEIYAEEADEQEVAADAGLSVGKIENFRASGEIALAPGWIYDRAMQTARPTRAATVAIAPSSPPPAVEVAKAVPLPVANPLFAARTDTKNGADAPVVGELADTAPLPPKNPLLTGRVRLASLAPVEAPLSDEPASSGEQARLPGPGDRFAVYDIKARTVYMPDGQKLEAHSGLGDMFDNPRHVSVKMRGPTPPNTYDLTMRERLFHGVEALRMNPVGDGKMYGRNGLLTHSYLLGPRGDSNGCVSFKEYEKFLAAYKRGHVTRLVVVESLPNTSGPASSLLAWLKPR